jgi:hypothetical protein
MTLWIDGETRRLYDDAIDSTINIDGYSFKHEFSRLKYKPDLAYKLTLNMRLLAYCKGLNRR